MNNILSTIKKIFPITIPVLTGYIFLGIAFGILMNSKGYSLIWVFLFSTFIYAGAMQFVSIPLLASGFHPLSAVLLTVMVNARFLFYGISMLTKFKNTRKLKPYLIFGLTDETFSLLTSVEPPKDMDKAIFMFYITVLNQIYWIIGSLLGCILNSVLNINTTGIDFVLTALFVVIFIDKWKQEKKPIPFIIGLGASIICLILFGSSNFILPTMVTIVVLVTVLKDKKEWGNL